MREDLKYLYSAFVGWRVIKIEDHIQDSYIFTMRRFFKTKQIIVSASDCGLFAEEAKGNDIG